MKHNPFPAALLCLLLTAAGGCTTSMQPVRPVTGTPPVSAGDNSRVSLDWEGTYRGVLPCADCEGIETEVTIRHDGWSHVRSTYLGRSDKAFSREGRFTWDADGRSIVISLDNGTLFRYLVGENQLVMLDSEGRRIAGQLAERYTLRKIMHPAYPPAASLVETYWKLVELNGQPVVAQPGGKAREAHMILKIAGNRVQGSGGCNRFFGSYELKPGNRIRFSGIGSTMMACPGIESEAVFFRALETADSYAVNGDKLQLHKARMAPLARFEAVWLK